MLALKVLLHAKNLERARNDGSRVGQTAASQIATCQISLIGLDEHGAADAELADVVAGGSRLVHVHVHGRRQHERRGTRQGRGGEQIVGDAVGQLGQDVGRARRDDEGIGLLSKRDVMNGIGRVVEQVDRHLLVGKRSERDGINEMRGVLSHAHLHTHASLLKAADDLAGFICGNAAGYAQQHRFLRFCSLATHDDPPR